MSGSEVLKATKREKVGTRTAKKLRAAGRIPANLQGEGHEHVDFSIDKADFFATRRHHTHLYDIDIDGNLESAVVRELQWDVFGDHILHVEFKRVIRGQKTESQVPIEFVGHPKGGVLNHIADQLTISCLPSEIPDSILIKTGEMEEGDLLRAGEVELPEGMDLAMDPETPVCSVAGADAAEPEAGDDDEEDGEAPVIAPAE